MDLSAYRVVDRFYIKRCNKCQDFGHYHGQCTNDPVCGYCGEKHESSTCPLKDETDFSKHKCINCKKANLPFTGHSAFWSKCPAYEAEQKKLQSSIPYYAKSPTNHNLNR